MAGLLEQAAEQAVGIGLAMANNFRACDRDQAFLFPPDLRDWLPADHLAWFVRDVVDQLDLEGVRLLPARLAGRWCPPDRVNSTRLGCVECLAGRARRMPSERFS